MELLGPGRFRPCLKSKGSGSLTILGLLLLTQESRAGEGINTYQRPQSCSSFVSIDVPTLHCECIYLFLHREVWMKLAPACFAGKPCSLQITYSGPITAHPGNGRQTAMSNSRDASIHAGNDFQGCSSRLFHARCHFLFWGSSSAQASPALRLLPGAPPCQWPPAFTPAPGSHLFSHRIFKITTVSVPPQDKPGLPAIAVNEVLLEPSHTRLFTGSAAQLLSVVQVGSSGPESQRFTVWSRVEGEDPGPPGGSLVPISPRGPPLHSHP